MASSIASSAIGQLSMVARIQSGRLVDLGNVRLVGMTADDVQGFFKMRFDDAGKKIWMFPQDVIDNTDPGVQRQRDAADRLRRRTCRPAVTSRRPTVRIASRSTAKQPPPPDYGDCGVRSLVVTGPTFQQLRRQRRETGPGRRADQRRIPLRDVECVQQRELHPVGPGRVDQSEQGPRITLNNYEVTQLTGNNQARVIQFVTRSTGSLH